MDNTKNTITSEQFCIFLFGVQIGLPIMYLPNLAADTGHDGWISMIIAGLCSTIFCIFLSKFLIRYSDKSIFEINKLLFGAIMGNILSTTFIIYIILTASLYGRLLLEAIRDILLRKTPSTVLSVFLIAPTIYLSYYGLKPICRFSNIIYIILGTLLLYFALVLKYYRLTFIMPVGEAGLYRIAKGAYSSMYCYLGPEIALIFYPYFKGKKNITRALLVANSGAIIIFTMRTLLVTMFFGENMLKYFYMPLISLSRAYRAPVLERIDIYFIAMWFPALALSIRGYFYSGYYSVKKILSLNNKPFYLFLYTFIIILLGRIPSNLENALEYLKMTNRLGAYLWIYIILCYLFSFINKRGVPE